MARSACLRMGVGVVWAQITWSTFAQTTYYVDAACGDDAWTGTSPVCVAPNGPKRTIQAGIDASITGDTVIVANGTYVGFGNRNLDLAGRDIVLRSASRDPKLCVIDCENSGRGFIFRSGESPAAIVQGFTITGGSAGEGGAIFCESSSPTILACIITGGRGFSGGAIFCESSSPTILDCILSECQAASNGGAIYCRGGSHATIRNCVITENSASSGGGIYLRAGSNATVDNCVIAQNSSGGSGGGIDSNSSSPIITRCTIIGNEAWGNAFNGVGGGISCAGAGAPIITNCVISRNFVGSFGGRIFCGRSDPVITNCTITENEALVYGGGVCCIIGGETIISNSMVVSYFGAKNHSLAGLTKTMAVAVTAAIMTYCMPSRP